MTDESKIKFLLKTRPKNLAEDEKEACFKLLNAVSRKLKLTGKPNTWAAAVYHAYCRMVFKQNVTRQCISDLFEISDSAFGKRYTDINKILRLNYYDKRFTPKRIYEKSFMVRMEKYLTRLKELEEWKRKLTHSDFAKVFNKIMEFIDERFPKEFEKALKQFSRKQGKRYGLYYEDNTVISESRVADNEFMAWFLFERKLSQISATPVDYYLQEFAAKELSIVEKRIMHKIQHKRRSFFEIIDRRGKDYRVKDLLGEDEILVKTVDMKPIEKGRVISARTIPMSGFWRFFGAVEVFSEEQGRKIKRDIASRIERAVKPQEDVHEKFLEYFKQHDPEFEDVEKLEDALTKFEEWLRETYGEEIKFSRGFREEFKDFDRIGMVSTDRGICFIPYYGRIKDIFTGNHDRVPGWESLFNVVLKRGFYIPDQVLRMLIYSNKETTLKVFREFSLSIKNFDDVTEIVENWRPNIHAKVVPIIRVSENVKKKKIGRNDPCPCGSGKKYKKCCLVV